MTELCVVLAKLNKIIVDIDQQLYIVGNRITVRLKADLRGLAVRAWLFECKLKIVVDVLENEECSFPLSRNEELLALCSMRSMPSLSIALIELVSGDGMISNTQRSSSSRPVCRDSMRSAVWPSLFSTISA